MVGTGGIFADTGLCQGFIDGICMFGGLLLLLCHDIHRGKWTQEEENYANRLIQEFKSGLLPLTDGKSKKSHDGANSEQKRLI